ncbi:MAG: DUF1311 domain-containing protein [Bdellovibrionales bacterium]|nr:DUF1311 domain-containing protein [Bdellovibrionales bacterium]
MRNLLSRCATFGVLWLPLSLQAIDRQPSFNCGSVQPGSTEELVCQNSELSTLDSQLDEVYRAALAIDEQSPQPSLKTLQRGWIKGRNDCWKADDQKLCIQESYQSRIAELQALYRLVQPDSLVSYQCSENQADEIVISFFPTHPNTAILERGDRSYLLFQQKDSDKKLFQGQNEQLTVEGNDVTATLEYQGPLLHCSKQTRMHPSWDLDRDGINDCEKDGSCDHTIDYSQPRA